MDILSYKAIYYDIQKDKDGCRLIEKTSCNYLHITLIMICFICCIGNWLWIVFLPLVMYTISMILKNCIFLKIYHMFPKKGYQMEYHGSRYSFKEPKTYLISKQLERR